MREFFLECLKDLKDIYGCNQIHWLMQECANQEEFNKKKNLIVDSLVTVSKRFDYIPEEVQQKYIRKMLIEDQNYDSLNTRVVWKWLDMHKVNHMTHSQFDEERISKHEPATDEQVAKYVKEFQENLEKIGNPEFANGMKDIRKKAGFEVSISANAPRPEFIVGDVCPNCLGKGFVETPTDKDVCMECDLTGKVNRFVVHAVSQEEADKSYEAFKQQA